MKIDIAIPTFGGETTITESITHVIESINKSDFKINKIIIDWKPVNSEDSTAQNVMELCENRNVSYVIHENNHNLPESRQFLIEQINTEWFLFLDDDVMLTESATQRLYNGICSTTGAIQVRRVSDSNSPSKWCQWRPVRGTLFATLMQMGAIEGIEIPSDVTVVEDQFIRQYIENNGYNWVFDPYAKFTHHSQDRHEIGFNEGYIAGKYDLLPLWYIFGNVIYNPIRWEHYKRGFGYIYGRWFQ